MQGRPKTRKNNFLKRPEQRSLDRRERRKKQRAMSLQQTISEEDNRAIADLQAKYGSGPFLAADAVVQSRDGHVLLIQRGKPPQREFTPFLAVSSTMARPLSGCTARADRGNRSGFCCRRSCRADRLGFGVGGLCGQRPAGQRSAWSLDFGSLLFRPAFRHRRAARFGG